MYRVLHFLVILFALTSLISCNNLDDIPTKGNIKFESSIAKARFVEQFDLDNDAELSYAEAAAVSSLLLSPKEVLNISSGIDIAGIKTLDELQYFVGLSTFELQTKGRGTSVAISLERISIPKSVTYIKTFGGVNAAPPYLTKVTCYAPNPPSGIYQVFYSKDVTLYVPKKSVDAYKEAIKKDMDNEAVLSRIVGF